MKINIHLKNKMEIYNDQFYMNKPLTHPAKMSVTRIVEVTLKPSYIQQVGECLCGAAQESVTGLNLTLMVRVFDGSALLWGHFNGTVWFS